MDNFVDTGLSAEILKAIEELGFERPTPIQAKAIPQVVTSDQDLVALAQTGTGKTAAFGLPLIHHIDTERRRPQAIILSPTRELCIQIANDLKKYSKYVKGLDVVPVYGGSSIDTQIRALKRGAHIVVGTPGRTNDLIRRKRLILEDVERVVLDEADEMLTMGFKEEIDTILEEVPFDRQTLLFSATMSKKVLSIAKKFMEDPIQISVAKVNQGSSDVTHLFYLVSARDKYETLKRIADVNPDIYGIVFCRTRRETKEVANKLMVDGYNADALHGDMSQAQRDDVMGKFRIKSLQILVATDVASRGLDVNDLTHVINFNLPDDDEVYVHRSGRTGRAGRKGISIAILHSREVRRINDIERKSGISFSKMKVPTGEEICEKQLYALIDKVKKVEVDEGQIEPYLPAIYEKLESLDREQLIKHFVSTEFNQFLAYYKNSRDINLSDRKKGDRQEQGRRSRNFSRFHINVGGKHKLTPARMIGLINDSLRPSRAEIGKIEILKNFSFFEIEEGLEQKVLQGMNQEVFEGVEIQVEVAKPKTNSPSRGRGYGGGRRRGRDDFRKKGRRGAGRN